MQKVEVLKAVKACSREIMSSHNESESVTECEKNFDYAKIEKIKKGFNEIGDIFLSQK